MARQILLGTILGGVILFLWSFVAWTFVPWPGEPVRGFTTEEAIHRQFDLALPSLTVAF